MLSHTVELGARGIFRLPATTQKQCHGPHSGHGAWHGSSWEAGGNLTARRSSVGAGPVGAEVRKVVGHIRQIAGSKWPCVIQSDLHPLGRAVPCVPELREPA
jgi:hypothetical protein